MKKLLPLIILINFLASCDYSPEKDKKIRDLENRVNTLTRNSIKASSELNSRDEFISEMLNYVNDARSKLQEINENEDFIEELIISSTLLDDSENKGSLKNDLNLQIDKLLIAIKKEQQNISEIEKKYGQSISQISSLRTLIKNLNSDITMKQKSIIVLQERVENLEKELEITNQKLNSATKKIEHLSTTYFVVGSPTKLRADKFTRKYRGKTIYNLIDRTKMKKGNTNTKKIFLGNNVKSIKIFSQHQYFSEYYRFQKNSGADYLLIIDPTSFWGVQKDLVIEIK